MKWNKKAKEYGKKRLGRMFMMVGFVAGFGITILAYMLYSGDWSGGALVILIIGYPSVITSIIYALLVIKRCNKITLEG